ncbi:hypothetical protein [Adhaeribacter rhizoryzae]|nr:hypothetical protein [Adhaeribacter rhizoryzae]
MHTKDALKHGETTQRLFLLNAWNRIAISTHKEVPRDSYCQK